MFGADFLFSRLLDTIEKTGNGNPKRNSHAAKSTLNIPVVEAQNREILYQYSKERIERTKIGEVESYRRPFTQQIRSDLRGLHSILTPFFDHADRTSDGVVNTAVRMRAITLACFIAYVLIALYAACRFASSEPSADFSSFFQSPLFWLPPFAAFFVVGLIRYSQIREIKTKAGDFGGAFNGNLQLLNNKANFALERVSDDAPTSEGCEKRAEEWTSIALWFFNLHNVYDRYVTTSSWSVQTRLHYATQAFRLIKWALLVAAGFVFVQIMLGDEASSMTASFLLLAYYSLGLFVWDVFPGRGVKNSVFADSFVSSISGREAEEIFENHVNTKTARLVRKLRGLYYNALKAH